MISRSSRLIAAFCSASLLAAAPASAAVQASSAATYSPWAALSAFAAPVSSQALCGSAAAAAASSAAQGTAGCVFPTVDAPVAPPVADAGVIATPAAVSAGGGVGVGVLPLLVGLAALGGLAALLLADNDDTPDQISVSP